MTFTAAHMSLGNIMKLSCAVTRSISAENVYGEKGRGGMAEVSDVPQPEVEKIGQVWERQKAARHHAGYRLAQRDAPLAAAGRHRRSGILVSE